MKFIVARTIACLIEKKQLNEIRSILDCYSYEERRDIVCEKIKKKSLLFIAIQQKENAVVNYLINECGANVKKAGHCLSMAAYNQSFEIVKLLVNNGAEINSADDEEKSALCYACSNGNMAMVEYLVENGAKIDQQDIKKYTPLMLAVEYPHICRYLLMKGADPNHVNVYGRTALMLAVENEIFPYSVDILLIYNANAKFTNEFGENAVFLAADKGNFQLLETIRYYEADIINSSAKSYQMISCIAALENNEYKAKYYWTMSLDILKMPMETPIFHINQSCISNSSVEPLENILNSNRLKAMIYLIRIFGLYNPYTIKAIATAMFNSEDIRVSLGLFNFFLSTLMSTKNVTFFRMFTLVSSMCTRLQMILKYYIPDNTLEIVQGILKIYEHLGVDLVSRFRLLSNREKTSKSLMINAYFSSIITLMELVYTWNSEALSALNNSVEKIVSLNIRGSNSNSLLHYFIFQDYPLELCKTLLLCKADATSKNKDGLTPVHCIMQSPKYQKMETIEMFIKFDFRLNEWRDGEFCIACNLNKLRICPQPVNNTSLQCLAAKIVNKNQSRYGDEVPRHLKSLVYSHF